MATVKPKKPKKEYALNIWSVLSKLEHRDLHVYENLSFEEKKELSPYTAAQWLFSTNDRWQVLALNELVNPYIFSFPKHPELTIKLLALCGTNTNKRFTWSKLPHSKVAIKLRIKVMMEACDYSEREAKDNVEFLSAADYIELAENLGWEKTEIAKLKAELK